MQILDNIRIVLVATTHPGNIGAVARAMKNMRLSRLYLVTPLHFPNAEATARASGADDLLANCQVCANLDEALAGCRLVVGTSARERTINWPILNPRESAGQLLAEAKLGDVAMVFGRESSGLSNSELDRCNYLVHIPANPDFSSLNLAAAVQVMAYELHMGYLSDPLQPEQTSEQAQAEMATADMLQGLHEHLEQALVDIGFADPKQSETLLRRLRSLFHRARPDAVEVNILRGILSAAQGRKSMRR